MKKSNYVLNLAVKSQASLYMNAHFSVCVYFELGLSEANSKNVINIRKYFSGMPLDANIAFYKTLNSMRTYIMKQMAKGTMLTVTYPFVLVDCNYFPFEIPYSYQNTKNMDEKIPNIARTFQNLRLYFYEFRKAVLRLQSHKIIIYADSLIYRRNAQSKAISCLCVWWIFCHALYCFPTTWG